MLYSACWRMTQVCMLAAISSSLYAVDGVILIDQNHALSGNITPGDAPGFPVTISQPGSYRLSGDLLIPDANTTGDPDHRGPRHSRFERLRHYRTNRLHI